jgi:glycosyltransferase involved in cell wall biosynthesis
MRYGKPILAAADGAVRQIIEDARCGWYVTPEDPLALSGMVLEAHGAGSELGHMGDRGREVARRLFNLDRVVREYARVLEGVVDKFQHDALP